MNDQDQVQSHNDQSHEALDQKDIRINELTATVRETERKLRALEALVADASDQAEEARRQHAQAVERTDTLRRKLDVKDQKLDSLQSQLEASDTELKAARESISTRDQKIASLEQELSHHAKPIATPERTSSKDDAAKDDDVLTNIDRAIGQSDSASSTSSLVAMGYMLESTDEPGKTHRISKEITTIGRMTTNDIAINSKTISRRHARLVLQPEGVWLIDLQSGNGCSVNGRRISGHLLNDGDAVVIGECNFKFLVSRLSESAEEQAMGETMALLDEPLFIYAAPGTKPETSLEKRERLESKTATKSDTASKTQS